MIKKYSKEFYKKIYVSMLTIRFCEERLVEPIIEGLIKGPVHLYSGQEAIAAGVCAALKRDDYIFGNHRSHGHFLAKGGSIKELFAEIYGKQSGCSKGRGGSMHICAPGIGMMGSAPIVAGTVSLALGSALAAKIRKEKRVTISFFGDGAMGEGAVYESFNFAVLKKLPIVFICENNLYSTHLPIKECRPENNIFKSGIPFCLPSFRKDGNNVLQVYEIAKQAVDLCRKGKGPVFIEFITYRLRGHVGPNDNIQGQQTDIRSEEELIRWRKQDPLLKMGKMLLRNNIFNKEELKIIEIKLKREIERAHQFAVNSPFPKENDLHKYVFKQ